MEADGTREETGEPAARRPARARAARPRAAGAPAAKAPTSFWTSLPGVITGITGLVAAITGLILGLNQAGLIGGKAASAEPVTAAGPAGPRFFRVVSTPDGFAAVRDGPNIQELLVAKLPSGARVECGDAVEDRSLGANRHWRLCKTLGGGGYVSDVLLKRVGD